MNFLDTPINHIARDELTRIRTRERILTMAAAEELLIALHELLECPELNQDDLDDMTLVAIVQARAAIALVHPNALKEKTNA